MTPNNDQATKEFVENLVLVIAKRPIWALKPEVREKIVSKCIRIFQRFMKNYIRENYGENELEKFEKRIKYGDLALDIYPTLKVQMRAGLQAFVKLLKEMD